MSQWCGWTLCGTGQGSGYLCNTHHYFLVFAISKLVLESTSFLVPLFHYSYLNSIIHPAWGEKRIIETFPWTLTFIVLWFTGGYIITSGSFVFNHLCSCLMSNPFYFLGSLMWQLYQQAVIKTKYL